MPCSVTTQSTSARAVVTTPSSRANLIDERPRMVERKRDDRPFAGERGGAGEVDLPANGAEVEPG